ncbi:MAG: HNH endonuclease [Ilumatobacteraceae bacterium]
MSSDVVIGAIAAVVGIAGLGAAGVVFRRWRTLVRLVDASSAALRELAALDARFRTSTADRGTLKLAFHADVTSKARFDRFDLTNFLLDSIAGIEQQVRNEVSARRAAEQAHREYSTAVADVAGRLLGTTPAVGVDQARYDAAERRRFERRRIKPPKVEAKVTGSVAYTSPKGRNSYRRGIQWGFAELERALAEVTNRDQRRSRVDEERRLMTNAMRVDVLRRDGHRCKMCGRDSGVIELHVDHVVPVSHGGRTTMDNLQTLCRDCNLGKSNRFVG